MEGIPISARRSVPLPRLALSPQSRDAFLKLSVLPPSNARLLANVAPTLTSSPMALRPSTRFFPVVAAGGGTVLRPESTPWSWPMVGPPHRQAATIARRMDETTSMCSLPATSSSSSLSAAAFRSSTRRPASALPSRCSTPPPAFPRFTLIGHPGCTEDGAASRESRTAMRW